MICSHCGEQISEGTKKRNVCIKCELEIKFNNSIRYRVSSDLFSKRICSFLDTLTMEEIESKAHAFFDEEEKLRNTYCFGVPGTGKTIGSACAFVIAVRNQYVNNHGASTKNFKFVNCPELLHEIRNTFQLNSLEQENQVVDRYTKIPNLIIDDLGASKISDWVISILYLIVNRRYEDLKVTIFTSNLSLQSLLETDCVRVASRIKEMCDGNILVFKG